MKFTRYGLLVRKIRIERGDSVGAASEKIGISETTIVNIEDKGRSPSVMFDVLFRGAYPQNDAMTERLKRFFVEANQLRILKVAR